jgi:riboflavin synthase alpha subunit
MFTGLIETLGEIVDAQASPAGLALRVSTALAGELADGDSLAVNGLCLTVVRRDSGTVGFDVGPETIRVSTVGAWRPGQRVNLERSMRADGRFGGHFVQGHVDATGTLRALQRDGDTCRLTIAFPLALAPLLVPKGSVAVDGISLTVAALDADTFDVMIVPFTWDHTNLSGVRVGERLNLEGDMIGKYVARTLDLTTARAK